MDLHKRPSEIGTKETPKDTMLTEDYIGNPVPEPADHEPYVLKHIALEVCVYDVNHLVLTHAKSCPTNKEIGETKD